MQIEIRTQTISNLVYWVTDKDGNKHLCHDPIYADWLERKFRQEEREASK